MIYIISQESDISTKKVLRYLSKSGKPFFCFDLTAAIIHGRLTIKITNSGFLINIYDNIITDANIDQCVFWYRRQSSYSDLVEEQEGEDLKQIIFSEAYELSESFYLLTMEAKWLGRKKRNNKIEMLYLAQKVGLQIPDTILTAQRDILDSFMRSSGVAICKSVGNAFQINYRGEKFLISPHLVDDIQCLPECFLPSIVQCYVDKEFDIRVFYLDGHCFASAIFSQEFEDTKIDFRINPNLRNNIRIVPIHLPNKLLVKIDLFMNLAGLDTGSIDFVFKNNKYIFLEVNPQGQFGNYANECGYNLYEMIANKLLILDNE